MVFKAKFALKNNSYKFPNWLGGVGLAGWDGFPTFNIFY